MFSSCLSSYEEVVARAELTHPAHVRCVAASDVFVVTGSNDPDVRVWSAETGALIKELVGHTAAVQSVDVSKNSLFVVSGSCDKTAIVWSAVTWLPVFRMEHTGRVRSVCFTPRNEVVTGSWGSGAQVWSLDTKTMTRQLNPKKDFISSVVSFGDGLRLATGSVDGEVMIWSSNESVPTAKLSKKEDGSVTALAVSPNGEMLAVGCSTGIVRVWWTDTGMTFRKFMDHTAQITSLSFSNEMLASTSHDKTIRVRVLAQDKSKVMHGEGLTACCVIAPTGELLTGSNRTVTCWSAF